MGSIFVEHPVYGKIIIDTIDTNCFEGKRISSGAYDLGEEKMTNERLTDLQNKMQTWIDAGAFPGCAFGMIGEKNHYCALGNAMITPEIRPVTLDTVYDLASLTKVVGTVPAILHLIEGGELTLDTAIASIISEAGDSSVTICQCLTHTSGAPADFPYQDLTGKEAVVKRAASLLPKAGTDSIQYSDINFILLGEVIERISGMGLAQAFGEWIFKPLGMIHTGFSPNQEKSAPTEVRADRGLVWGEAHDGKAHAMGGVSGHAGLFSTVEDIGKFVTAVLNRGIGEQGRFLSEASIELMAREHARSEHDRRGLGWMMPYSGSPLGDLCSDRSLFHTGFAGGSILMDLERKAGMVMLTNRIHPSRDNRAILALRPRFNNMAIVAAKDL